MWHKPCRTFHPWCLCIKTRCLYCTVDIKVCNLVSRCRNISSSILFMNYALATTLGGGITITLYHISTGHYCLGSYMLIDTLCVQQSYTIGRIKCSSFFHQFIVTSPGAKSQVFCTSTILRHSLDFTYWSRWYNIATKQAQEATFDSFNWYDNWKMDAVTQYISGQINAFIEIKDENMKLTLLTLRPWQNGRHFQTFSNAFSLIKMY